MERVYYLGEATAAGIISVASAEHLIIWASFLILAEMAVCVLFRQQSQSRTKSVPVPANARRMIRCARLGTSALRDRR
jgi:hypothetical protein